jgi:hypothetical protein
MGAEISFLISPSRVKSAAKGNTPSIFVARPNEKLTELLVKQSNGVSHAE